MRTRTILAKKNKIIEIISQKIIIKNEQDVVDILGNIDSQFLVLHDYNFEKEFFDLSTRKLGEILHRFSVYQVRLAIIGYFDKYPSKILKDFIYESNRHSKFLFVSSIEKVKKAWG